MSSKLENHNGQEPRVSASTTSYARVPRAQRRALSAEEKTNIALDRYEPMRSGKSMEPIETLATRYRRDPAVITRAIASAFSQGLVNLVATGRTNAVTLSSFGKRVEDKYPGLRKAIVVQTADLGSAQPAKALEEARRKSAAERQRNDMIHRRLGYAMAQSISEWSVREGDTIGFGSGRGVFYTVEAAMQLPTALRVEGLNLMSLTGAVLAHDHSNLVNTSMDADLHTALFGLCVQHIATLHLVTYPISEAGAKERSCLGPKQWRACHPTHALTGIGVLAEGHRFFEQGKGGTYDSIWDPVIDDLQELVGECKRISTDYGCDPVADICNHLILVDCPDVPTEEKNTLRKLVDHMNEKLLNVSAEQLSEISNLMIVAGGKRKARALKQILRSESFKTRIICIDEELAAEITKN